MVVPVPTNCPTAVSLLMLVACWLGIGLGGEALGGLPDDAPAQVDTARSAPAARGVVWSVPGSRRAALLELERIRAVGATAVRVRGPIAYPSVLQRADSLNLRVYLDLPLRSLSAEGLAAALDTIDAAAERVGAQAQQFASVAAVGLGASLDTSTPATCRLLDELASRVRAHAPDARLYYVTPFRAKADRCTDRVDRVLIDTRGLPDPVARWAAWQDGVSGVGVGSAGTWVDPGAGRGLLQPHSPERQARYLETALTTWIPDRTDLDPLNPDTVAPPPEVFVSRWKYEPAMLERGYGLHTPEGDPRPSRTVVHGIYSGEQRVFAFERGIAPGSGASGAVAFGWVIVALLAILYARRPLFRRSLARYFTAHGFYCDAVREGRDTMPVASATLLAVTGIAIGVVVGGGAYAVQELPATSRVVEALPAGPASVLAAAIEAPLLTAAWTGGVGIVLLVLWAAALQLASRQWTALSAGQALMLVTWPCWPALPWMGAALVVASLNGTGAALQLGLVAAGGLATLAVVGRVLYDYAVVTRIPAAAAAGLALVSPPALVAGTVFILSVRYEVPVAFLIHLATRT